MRATDTGRRRGFTLIEMMVASFLMVLMAALLANTWVVFGRSALSAVARVRIAQEANLAAATLAEDIGRLARPPGRITDSIYPNIQVEDAGHTIKIPIDDGTRGIRFIRYSLDQADPSKLVRADLSAAQGGTDRVVATLVSGFRATAVTTPNEFNASGVRIDLTFSHRTNDRDRDGTFRGDHTRRFTLFVPDPQP